MGYPKGGRGPFLKALRFGLATSNRVNMAAGLNNIHTFSVAVLIFPTTFTIQRAMWYKGGSFQKGLRFSDSSGNIEIFSSTATTAINTVSTTVFLRLNTWRWLFATCDDTAKQAHLYYCSPNDSAVTAAAETVTTGSGAASSESDQPHAWGNEPVTNTAFQGSIACGVHYNRVITKREMASIAQGMFPLNGCDILVNMGERGAGRKVINYAPPPASGRIDGTISGALAKAHELGVPFRPMMRRIVMKAPAAGGGTAFPDHYYRMMRASS